MLVEGGDIQDELLDQLGGVLAPPEDLALAPSAEELEALALAVSVRWPDGRVDRFENIQAGQILRIDESKAPAQSGAAN